MQHFLVPFEKVKNELLALTSPVDYFIGTDDEFVEIEGHKFQVLHTPGHSPSHISIITQDNVMVIGDVLMTNEEIEKAKLPYAMNFDIDFETKRKITNIKCDKYVFTHKGVRDNIIEEVEKNIEYIKSRANVILGYIEDGMSYDDIAAEVINCMNIKVHSRYAFFDIYGMIASYIQYLEESGKIEGYYENGYIRYRVLE